MSVRGWQLTDSETLQLFDMSGSLARYFGKRTQRQDVESLVDITLIEAGARFERRASLRYFVFAIARRQLAQVIRARAQQRARPFRYGDRSLDAGTGIETLLDRQRRSEKLDAALARVPQIHREIVRLWLAGHDSVQIAEMLGLNYNTTRSRLSQGRAVLLAAYLPAIDA